MTMANYKPLPLLPLLRELLLIDESSPSGLRWKVKTARRIQVNDVAGTLKTDRYWYVRLNGSDYLAHRIIFYIYHGTEPGGLQIDHIDRNKSNNRIDNLRLVDRSSNQRNIGLNSRNKSGCKGVYFHRGEGKYRARIGVYGKKVWLGDFENIEDAIAARKAGEIEYWGQNY